MPFYPSLGEGSPIKIDYRKKGTLLEDLGENGPSYSRPKCQGELSI